MISINPTCENATQSAYGWKNPFGDDPSKWVRNQQRPEPYTLEHIAGVICNTVWSPFLYKKDHRCEKDFLEAHWIGLDFDSGKTLTWAVEEFRYHACIIGTTKSHGLAKGPLPACDRFRVLLKLNGSTKIKEDLKATLAALVNRYGSDAACKDAARFFMPCRDIVFVGKEGGDLIPLRSPPTPLDRRYPISIHQKDKRPSGYSITDLILGAGFREGGRNTAVNKAAFALFAPYFGHSFDYVYRFIRPLTDIPESELLATLISAKDGQNGKSNDQVKERSRND